ncbi:MAG TPA: carboxypeptidase regulatory-like domain-containing protein [Gemmatimonadaceae bacterium]|nr:carboxypeptidase regulatory-like domain-containing protein [Gemmatimonadaceae bacterium]
MISGAVIDSVRGGLLIGGTVVVDGLGRMGMTDSVGVFLIDSVPPGEYRLALLDELLDTLSLSVVSPDIRVVAGDTTYLVMALPSPETIVAAKCGPGPFPGGRAALVGVVINAETERRVAGADVVLAWSEVQASRDIGLRTIPRQRSTKTADDGSFKICGLSNEIRAELMAWSGRDTTAAVPFSFVHPQLAMRTLALPSGIAAEALAADTGAQPAQAGPRTGEQQVVTGGRRGRSTISGRVTTLGGTPIVGARVSLTGAEGVALTNERGEFVLGGQPAGTQSVLVRRLGFEPAEFAVNLSATRPTEVSVELPEFVPVLSTVVVRAQMDVALDKVGFSRRKKAGMGHYMMLEDIDRRGAMRTVDLLAGFPMLRAISTGGTNRQITGRSRGLSTNCVTFYVDGVVWMGDDSPTDFMHPQEIGAIEAYTAATTPAEFARTLNSCETVVIWTRHRLGIIR